MSFTPEDVVSSYSRKQAIEDGVLIDVSTTFPDLVRPLFKLPVVFAQHLWALVEEAVHSSEHHNDPNGVVHDVLWMAYRAAKDAPGANRTTFNCIITGTSAGTNEHELILHIGPGDDGEPVITIMTPSDD